MADHFHPALSAAQIGAMSALGLAHVGDAVYELLVRTQLCASGLTTPDKLHRETVRRVSAPAQAAALERMLPALSEEELAIYKRGRNAHVHAVPKNATREQYSKATGLEALFGALYLAGRLDRVDALFDAGKEPTDAV